MPLNGTAHARRGARRVRLGERRRRTEQHDVRESSTFLLFAARERMVCLKRPHFAFFASLYF